MLKKALSDFTTKEQRAEQTAKKILANDNVELHILGLLLSAMGDKDEFTTQQIARDLEIDDALADALLKEFARKGEIVPITNDWKIHRD
jgi:hypothetical protein